MQRRRQCLLALTGLLAMPWLSGCVFRELREQHEQIDQLCLISGTIDSDPANRNPRVVVLLQDAAAGTQSTTWRLVDHFVSEGDGRWLMATQAGTYALAAFEDRSRDLIYQPGEPVLNVSDASQVNCTLGGRVEGVALHIPLDGGRSYLREIDLSTERLRTQEEQMAFSFSAVTAAGTVTTLSDPRFSAENVAAGMWAPYDFILNAGPGVYFLEKYDASRIPVLFVHGIDGSPGNFKYLIEHLDRQRFQAWVYYYPSGARLGLIADHLAQTVLQIELHYSVPKLIVVAHSMGGLVARGFLLRREPDRLRIPLFISLSTPWGGHSAAQMGVDHAPTVVRSWYDMAPASDYLQSLFYTQSAGRRSLPASTQHQLLFSFKKGSRSFGESGDEVVTVASELRAEAQDEAAGVYGFDDTHTGILEDPHVSLRVNKLLDAATAAR